MERERRENDVDVLALLVHLFRSRSLSLFLAIYSSARLSSLHYMPFPPLPLAPEHRCAGFIDRKLTRSSERARETERGRETSKERERNMHLPRLVVVGSCVYRTRVFRAVRGRKLRGGFGKVLPATCPKPPLFLKAEKNDKIDEKPSKRRRRVSSNKKKTTKYCHGIFEVRFMNENP